MISEPLHLFLFLGQSNMAGRGPLDGKQDPFHPHVAMLDAREQWLPAREPIHFDKPEAGASLAKTFALRLLEAEPNAKIGLVPCAVGGTPLSRWQKGGDLYQFALERARKAEGFGTIKAILWHQGEQDGLEEPLARTYGDRLAGMFTDLREDLRTPHVPVVTGTLGSFIRSRHPTRFHEAIDQALRALPSQIPRCICVEAAALKDVGDQVHFDTPSLRLLGVRYAEAYLQLELRNPPSHTSTPIYSPS